MRIFDVHTHAFPDSVAASAMTKLLAGCREMELHASHDGTVRGLFAAMDRAGVERAILCSVATRPEQVRKITDWSVALAADPATAGRIVPFASIHPNFPEPEAEVERLAAAGLKGLKFHPQYMDCALDDPRLLRLARAASGAGLAMVFHTGHDLAYPESDLATPAQVRQLHEAVPGLRIMACHMGGWRRWTEALREVAGLPIYLETSFTLGQCPEELLLRIIAKHPPEYLLFGSDAPWADPADDLRRLRALPLGDELRRQILWDNACRFVGLPIEG